MDVTGVSVFYDVLYGELNPQLGSSTACLNRIGGRQLDFDCSGKTVNIIEINLVEHVVRMGGGTGQGSCSVARFCISVK